MDILNFIERHVLWIISALFAVLGAFATLYHKAKTVMINQKYLKRSIDDLRKDMDQLESEYNLVVAKQSTRSRSQRDLISSRWEYEQTKTIEDQAE